VPHRPFERLLQWCGPGEDGAGGLVEHQPPAGQVEHLTRQRAAAVGYHHLDPPAVERLLPAGPQLADGYAVVESSGVEVDLRAAVDEHLPPGVQLPDEVAAPGEVIVDAPGPLAAAEALGGG